MNQYVNQRTRGLGCRLAVAQVVPLSTVSRPWTFGSSLDIYTAKGYVVEIVLIPPNLGRPE